MQAKFILFESMAEGYSVFGIGEDSFNRFSEKTVSYTDEMPLAMAAASAVSEYCGVPLYVDYDMYNECRIEAERLTAELEDMRNDARLADGESVPSMLAYDSKGQPVAYDLFKPADDFRYSDWEKVGLTNRLLLKTDPGEMWGVPLGDCQLFRTKTGYTLIWSVYGKDDQEYICGKYFTEEQEKEAFLCYAVVVQWLAGYAGMLDGI